MAALKVKWLKYDKIAPEIIKRFVKRGYVLVDNERAIEILEKKFNQSFPVNCKGEREKSLWGIAENPTKKKPTMLIWVVVKFNRVSNKNCMFPKNIVVSGPVSQTIKGSGPIDVWTIGCEPLPRKYLSDEIIATFPEGAFD